MKKDNEKLMDYLSDVYSLRETSDIMKNGEYIGTIGAMETEELSLTTRIIKIRLWAQKSKSSKKYRVSDYVVFNIDDRTSMQKAVTRLSAMFESVSRNNDDFIFNINNYESFYEIICVLYSKKVRLDIFVKDHDSPPFVINYL